MRITALAENTTIRSDIYPEHGLSLYIETKKHNILFDMGQTELFSKNAETLGIDLSDVDIAVLSHGHYDHGGGLEKFLRINKNAPVYLSKHAFGEYFNGTEKYIGLDKTLKDDPRLIFTDEELKIAEGMTLYSCNEREKHFNLGSFGLNMKEDEKILPDDFRHEQYLLIEENGKRVLVSGCSHKGILNIVHWFTPDVLIGGFHFSKLPLDKTLEEYCQYLDSFDTKYFTCHCTGEEQFEFMKRKMKNISYLRAGDSVTFL